MWVAEADQPSALDPRPLRVRARQHEAGTSAHRGCNPSAPATWISSPRITSGAAPGGSKRSPGASHSSRPSGVATRTARAASACTSAGHSTYGASCQPCALPTMPQATTGSPGHWLSQGPVTAANACSKPPRPPGGGRHRMPQSCVALREHGSAVAEQEGAKAAAAPVERDQPRRAGHRAACRHGLAPLHPANACGWSRMSSMYWRTMSAKLASGCRPSLRRARGAGAAGPVGDDAGDARVALEAHARAHRAAGHRLAARRACRARAR